jgi:hypothetical protein
MRGELREFLKPLSGQKRAIPRARVGSEIRTRATCVDDGRPLRMNATVERATERARRREQNADGERRACARARGRGAGRVGSGGRGAAVCGNSGGTALFLAVHKGTQITRACGASRCQTIEYCNPPSIPQRSRLTSSQPPDAVPVAQWPRRDPSYSLGRRESGPAPQLPKPNGCLWRPEYPAAG